MLRFSFPRAGFTLIELCVVLVVISLIIGGILVGREMVHASEINSLITDANRLKAANLTFKMKYRYFPGDMPEATKYWTASTSCPGGTSGTCNGNGDDNIDHGTDMWLNNGEWYRAWQHLSLSGILPGNYTGIPSSTTTVASAAAPGVNMLANRLGGFYGLQYASDAQHAANALMTWGSDPTQFLLTPSDAKTIDSKMDDGMPGTGLVSGTISTGVCTTSADLPTALYNVSSSYAFCNLTFWFE